MSAGERACFHCGEPIPRGLVIHARIAGRDEPVCCHGCKAVAEFISGAGLGDYYKYRDTSSTRADEPPRPDRWAPVQHFVAPGGSAGRCAAGPTAPNGRCQGA